MQDRLLLVDDDASLLKLLAIRLEAEGFAILTAASADGGPAGVAQQPRRPGAHRPAHGGRQRAGPVHPDPPFLPGAAGHHHVRPGHDSRGGFRHPDGRV